MTEHNDLVSISNEMKASDLNDLKSRLPNDEVLYMTIGWSGYSNAHARLRVVYRGRNKSIKGGAFEVHLHPDDIAEGMEALRAIAQRRHDMRSG